MIQNPTDHTLNAQNNGKHIYYEKMCLKKLLVLLFSLQTFSTKLAEFLLLTDTPIMTLL